MGFFFDIVFLEKYNDVLRDFNRFRQKIQNMVVRAEGLDCNRTFNFDYFFAFEYRFMLVFQLSAFSDGGLLRKTFGKIQTKFLSSEYC